ncbi:delta-class carbonic anhydrase [uncultured Roseobacter sp.]|uniref:delta-class carbonic anhydrase n=1 Tax=uncultured Roseobacter sp. TaxID=114847 RepID=UPI00261C0637|nr:delta-class carbonic anhydrase [uncultured Roseobacter sp.]
MKSALTLVLSLSAITAGATAVAEAVTDDDIAAQRAALAAATEGAGFGPQSPRDLSVLTGDNARVFARAPAHTEMNLCNIHFHENAEHKGGEFTTYAGNGNGKGAGTGFKYDGTLTEAELAPYENTVGAGKYGDLQPGDTIELHYVYTTAQVTPGPTLGSCLSEAIGNPQLRVEAQVFVLVNDDAALDFTEAARVEVVDGLHQAPGIPTDTGTPILYPGSTTGPSFNEAGSPLQVTWSVRPEVAKVSISSVETWLADNVFDENHAHGVRNLVVNPALLSPIN